MPRLVVDIADFPLALDLPPGRLLARARRRYRSFLGRGRSRLALAVTPGPAGVPRPLPVPRIRAAGRARLAVERRGDFAADLDLARGTGTARVREDLMSLDNLLRVVHAALLVRRGGLLAHAAGIRTGRGAWLFPAPSGSGKSTLSALAGARRVLSDELTAVARAGGAWVAMGTPFWGSFAEGHLNRTVPLAGLAFLRRAPQAACRPIPADEAARRLLRVAMTFETDVAGNARLLANVKRLVRTLPCVELSFHRRRPFGEVMRMLEETAWRGRRPTTKPRQR